MTTDFWYFLENNIQKGPVSLQELKQILQSKQNDKVYVWKAGLAEWVLASTLPQLNENVQYQEQRRAERVPIEGTVTLKDIGFFPLLNISILGLAFASQEKNLTLNQTVSGVIKSTAFIEQPSFQGVITRSIEVASMSGYALLFSEIKKQDLSILRAYISVHLAILL